MQNQMAALLKTPELRTCERNVHCWQDLPVSPDVAQRVRKAMLRLGPKRMPKFSRFDRNRPPGEKSKNRICRHCSEKRMVLDAAWSRYARALEQRYEQIGAHLRIMRIEREQLRTRHRSLKAELGLV